MTTNSKEPSLLTIVVPVYNEEASLDEFHGMLVKAIDPLDCRIQVLYVDDGSTDASPRILASIAQEDSRVHVLTLSRNFGHQAALTAGLDQAEGEVVITMDSDGQHPPELVPQMLDLYRSGYEVVITQRMDEQQASGFKKWTSGFFYWLINRMGNTQVVQGAADFRLLSRAALDGLLSMREYHRFLRGMVAWMGFKTVIIPYLPTERLGGKSKYSLKKMVGLATDAIFSFSLIPLQVGISLGIIFLFLALVEAIYVLSFWVTGRQSTLEPGWSSLMFMLLIVGGMIMLSLGFIGVYTGYIFQEVKKRPIYLLKKDNTVDRSNSDEQS